MMKSVLPLLALLSCSDAFNPAFSRNAVVNELTESSTAFTRRDLLSKSASVATVAAVTSFTSVLPAFAAEGDSVTLPSGVVYTITKAGDGPEPSVGELAAIRFKAKNGDIVIDDIFDTPEPYYTRCGSGGMIKGVEEVIPKMRVGDRWFLTIPGNMAFGAKGRPASAGKPRIQANAVITFDIVMVGLPGKEPELIDLIGDD